MQEGLEEVGDARGGRRAGRRRQGRTGPGRRRRRAGGCARSPTTSRTVSAVPRPSCWPPRSDGKAVLVANLHPEVSQKVEAGDIVREVSGVLGGGGGGGPTMAQAGGGNLEAIPDALARVREILTSGSPARSRPCPSTTAGASPPSTSGRCAPASPSPTPGASSPVPSKSCRAGTSRRTCAGSCDEQGRARDRRRGAEDARRGGRLPGPQGFGYTRRLEAGVPRRTVRGVGRAAHDPHRRRRQAEEAGQEEAGREGGPPGGRQDAAGVPRSEGGTFEALRQEQPTTTGRSSTPG